MKRITYLLLLFPLVLIAQQADVTINKEIMRVAFGSCSKQDQPSDQMWDEVQTQRPDLWVWLGDNIYGDTEDMAVMKEKYDLQKSHAGYQKLLLKTEVIGIWDDHDYGANDAGKEYPKKAESKERLFDFLDVDKNNPARKRQGAYQSYTYKSSSGNVKVILLDVRYFRDSLNWNNPNTAEKESVINPTGDILGQQQWKWLGSQLSEEGIDLFLIASGIQVLPETHRWEKWANFPQARERLLNVIKTVKTPLILLSGDRHLSEVSKHKLDGYSYPLYEFTSSSLNAPSTPEPEENKYRIGEQMHQQNFASMMIVWIANKPMIQLKYFGKDNKQLADYSIRFE